MEKELTRQIYLHVERVNMKLSIKEKRSNPVAMITGVGGQDGSYLAELLLSKGYTVVGISRRSSVNNTERISHLKHLSHLKLIEGDVTDACNVNSWFTKYKPDEFYNLAAQSHVGTSFEQPLLTFRVNAEGVLNILEAARHHSPKTRLYQASTSEMFGRNYTLYSQEIPGRAGPLVTKFQDENTSFSPQSPYAVAKIAAHNAFGLYRRAYGLHASCAIMFNHESQRRGEQFVTRKITKWIGEFKVWKDGTTVMINTIDGSKKWQKIGGAQGDVSHIFPDDQKHDMDNIYDQNRKFPKLRLGNLDSYRDWGHAEDYVEAMWRMLQQDEPDDYVIATGKAHSIEDFLTEAFSYTTLVGRRTNLWKPYVVQDPAFMRPAEVDFLCGNANKAKKVLGWEPKIGFEELVSRMVQNDIEIAHNKSKALLC